MMKFLPVAAAILDHRYSTEELREVADRASAAESHQ